MRQDKLLWENENLFVNSGLTALANLIAGITTGQYVTAIGFGSGTGAPQLSDTGLSAPTYYRAIGAATFPSSGQVEFTYSLTTSDYGAYGLTISELGLFANPSGVALPSAVGTANAVWAANTPSPVGTLAIDSNGNVQRSTSLNSWAASGVEVVGNLILDSNGNIQQCTTAGTTGSTSQPSWATTLNATTTDNTVTWTLIAIGSTGTTGSAPPIWATGLDSTTNDNSVMWTLVALHSAPILLIAHDPVPAFVFTGTGNYTGTWTLTM